MVVSIKIFLEEGKREVTFYLHNETFLILQLLQYILKDRLYCGLGPFSSTLTEILILISLPKIQICIIH